MTGRPANSQNESVWSGVTWRLNSGALAPLARMLAMIDFVDLRGCRGGVRRLVGPVRPEREGESDQDRAEHQRINPDPPRENNNSHQGAYEEQQAADQRDDRAACEQPSAMADLQA